MRKKLYIVSGLSNSLTYVTEFRFYKLNNQISIKYGFNKIDAIKLELHKAAQAAKQCRNDRFINVNIEKVE